MSLHPNSHWCKLASRLAFFAIVGVFTALWQSPASAQILPQPEPNPIVLNDSSQLMPLDAKAQYWVDETGQTTVAQLADLKPAWQSYRSGLVLDIHQKKFWLRFTADGTQADQAWWLDLPQPWLDQVSLNVQDAQGQWQVLRAGDMVPHSQWGQLSRTPRIQLPQLKGVHTYYVSVEHARAAYPVRLSLQSDRYLSQYRLFEELFFGVWMGVSVLVVLLATALAWSWRDSVLARFGAYFLFASLTVMSRMGLNSLLLWPESPHLNAWVARLLPLLSMSCGLWFLHAVVKRDEFMPRLERLLMGFALVALGLGVLEAVWPTMRSFQLSQLLGLLFSAVTLLFFLAALWRGNHHTRLISIGILPMVVASAFVVLRNAGVQPAGYEIGQFAAIAGLALQTPILLYALIRQSQELREQRVHAGNIDRVDALTGLSTLGVLEFNLRGSLARASMNQHNFMLMLVELINHKEISEKYGAATANRAMQTLAGLLQRLRRDVDTAARVEASMCMMLMERVITPSMAVNTATALLVRCMQPSKSLPQGVQLKLRISLANMPESDVIAEVGDQPGDCIRWLTVSAELHNNGGGKPIQHLNF